MNIGTMYGNGTRKILNSGRVLKTVTNQILKNTACFADYLGVLINLIKHHSGHAKIHCPKSYTGPDCINHTALKKVWIALQSSITTPLISLYKWPPPECIATSANPYPQLPLNRAGNSWRNAPYNEIGSKYVSNTSPNYLANSCSSMQWFFIIY